MWSEQRERIAAMSVDQRRERRQIEQGSVATIVVACPPWLPVHVVSSPPNRRSVAPRPRIGPSSQGGRLFALQTISFAAFSMVIQSTLSYATFVVLPRHSSQ